jgi:hypothetical protein
MDTAFTERDLKMKICEAIYFSIDKKIKDRIIINTPFTFEDGDVLKVVLRKKDNEWYLTDEGHTFMHLSYEDLDLTKGTRKELLDTILRMHYIINTRGELSSSVENGSLGDALFTFIQGLSKVSDLTFTRRDYIKSLFFEEFIGFLKEIFGDRAKFNYSYPIKDPNGKYKIDCFIPARRPIFIFGIPSVDKCRDTTITLLKFTTWDVRFTSISIYEDMETLPRRAVAKLSDVSDKSYSTLEIAKEDLQRYLIQTATEPSLHSTAPTNF